jgi:5'-nucleotidase
VDSVRCADGKGNVILLHAGDFSQGSSYFTELNGDIEVDVINAM